MASRSTRCSRCPTDPAGTGDDVPLEVQAGDALSACAALAARADIDKARIGLWGFSQGAWVALVATMSTDIAFLVLVAAARRTAPDS